MMLQIGKRWFSIIWSRYSASLDSRPLLTQASSTAVVCCLGDSIAQLLLENKAPAQKRYDLVRTIRMTSIGFFFTGPILRCWFVSLDKIFGPTKFVSDAVKKVLADQLLFAPLLTGSWITVVSFSRGLNKTEVKEKLKTDYVDMLLACYCVWPVTQMANFYFIPLKYRVGFVNIISLAWNTFIARMVNKPLSDDTQKDTRQQ